MVPDAMPVKVFGSSPRVTAVGEPAPIVTDSTVVPAGTSPIGVASKVTEFVAGAASVKEALATSLPPLHVAFLQT